MANVLRLGSDARDLPLVSLGNSLFRGAVPTVLHFRFPVFGLLFPVSFLSGSDWSGLGRKR